MPERTDHANAEPSLITAYVDAVQACREIGTRIGVRHCDDDPDWKAAEWRADHLYDKARAAGHTVEELLAANQARKAQR